MRANYINENKGIPWSGKDPTKAPVIGKLMTRRTPIGVGKTMKPEILKVVEIHFPFYILNTWYKSGVPQVIHDNMVSHFIPTEKYKDENLESKTLEETFKILKGPTNEEINNKLFLFLGEKFDIKKANNDINYYLKLGYKCIENEKLNVNNSGWLDGITLEIEGNKLIIKEEFRGFSFGRDEKIIFDLNTRKVDMIQYNYKVINQEELEVFPSAEREYKYYGTQRFKYEKEINNLFDFWNFLVNEEVEDMRLWSDD